MTQLRLLPVLILKCEVSNWHGRFALLIKLALYLSEFCWLALPEVRSFHAALAELRQVLAGFICLLVVDICMFNIVAVAPRFDTAESLACSAASCGLLCTHPTENF